MSGILSIHQAPFEHVAGILCESRRRVLERWREARLTIWKRNLPPSITRFLAKPSTMETLRKFDNIVFQVRFRDDGIRLGIDTYAAIMNGDLGSLGKETTFAEIFNHDPEAAPLIRDMERRARDAAVLFKDEDIYLRIRTLTMTASLHIDEFPVLGANYGIYTSVIANPLATRAGKDKKGRTVYRCDMRERRELGRGDVCVFGEIAHGSPRLPSGNKVDREGPWLGFWSPNVHHSPFQIITL